MPDRAIAAGLLLAAWISVAFLSAGTAAVSPSHDVEAGRALFQRNCAACHGESGRGDGPSAASFATKPANLADGRLMNPLPHEFLVNVVANGGPAVGLAPTMPAFRAFLGDEQIGQVIAYVRSIADPPFSPGDARPLVTVAGAPVQPILFNHVIHAGSFQIACQYCHTGARRGVAAGLPSVERCMGCHKIIGAQDNPEIGKIHALWDRRAPIPWIRVFKVPEFTYFPHKPHVRAGLACQTCHGPIERMQRVGAQTGPSLGNDLRNLVGLKTPPPPLSMGWCVDCHKEQIAQGKHPPLDCIACHH